MLSFVQRFALKNNNQSGNSIQEEIILDEMRAAQESMAEQISQANSAVENLESLLQIPETESKTEEETALEQEIEVHSLKRLLHAIEHAASPEELSALMQEYEELLADWSEKISLLRSEKHLKDYLEIAAALNMLRDMLKNPALLQGKHMSEAIQQKLETQQHSITEQAQRMQAQHQQLHLQAKQLSGIEQNLQATLKAMQQEVGLRTATQQQQIRPTHYLQESRSSQQVPRPEIQRPVYNPNTMTLRVATQMQAVQAQNNAMLTAQHARQAVVQQQTTMVAAQQQAQQVQQAQVQHVQQTQQVQHVQQQIQEIQHVRQAQQQVQQMQNIQQQQTQQVQAQVQQVQVQAQAQIQQAATTTASHTPASNVVSFAQAAQAQAQPTTQTAPETKRFTDSIESNASKAPQRSESASNNIASILAEAQKNAGLSLQERAAQAKSSVCPCH